MTRTKSFIFGLITMLVAPALFFVSLELGLKLAGFGKDYDYFNRISVDGFDYYQDNPAFAEQFFPAALDITPLHNTFSANKDDDTVRIFVLGGSAARGFPNPHHGFSRQMQTMLRAAIPDKRVEVINTAMTAINSHVVYEIAKAIPDGGVDYAVIYMGNNEVVGPYGPGTVYQEFLSSPMLIRFIQAVKRLRLSQGLSRLLASLAPRDDEAELAWKGMQMFTDNKIPHDDPRLAGVYSNYQRNLTDIATMLRSKGAHVLPSTVPVNLRDSAPFASAHRQGLSVTELDDWQQISESGKSAFEAQRWDETIDIYERALAIDPDYADSHYRLGMAFSSIGRHELSAAALFRSRDLDALRFRADTGINTAIRQVAKDLEGEDMSFVDSEAIFETTSRSHQPGWDLFLEHVHFTFAGNHLLAETFSRAVLQHMGRSDTRIDMSEATVALRVGYPNLGTVEVMDKLVEMVQAPPFTGQSNHAALLEFLKNENAQVKQQTASIEGIVSRYEQAIEREPVDWRMHHELADLYEKLGNWQGMYEQLSKVDELYPHNRDSHLMMARVLKQQGRHREEIARLQRATVYTRGDRKYLASILGQVGVAYYNAGDTATAVRKLRQLVRDYPEQVPFNLYGYGVLIQFARRSDNNDDLATYADQIQAYGESLLSMGKVDTDVAESIAGLLRNAGFHDRARAWIHSVRNRHVDEGAVDQ